MPLFEFACKKCGHRFEALVYRSDSPSCPKCGSTDLEQEFSSFAVSRQGNSGSRRGSAASSCGAGAGGG